MCIVDESVFSIPPAYKTLGSNVMPHIVPADEEDILLQLAIQQSLTTDGTEPTGTDQLTALEMFGYREPIGNNRFNTERFDFSQEDDDMILQRFTNILIFYAKFKFFFIRVLAESLNNSTTRAATPNIYENLAFGGREVSYDLQRVLEMSRREEERRDLLRKQEDEELERILQLSLLEK